MEKTLLEIVKEVLMNHKAARDDDMLLFEYVMNYHKISKNTSFDEVRRLIKVKELPTIESITICRRRVQEEIPELLSSEEVARLRRQRIPEYQAIGREKVNI